MLKRCIVQSHLFFLSTILVQSRVYAQVNTNILPTLTMVHWFFTNDTFGAIAKSESRIRTFNNQNYAGKIRFNSHVRVEQCSAKY